MSVVRYGAIVAAIYFLVFLGVVLLVGGADPRATEFPWRLWLLPFAAMAFSVLATTGAITRFGNKGGSLYFTPTVLHITLLIVIVFAVVRAL
jgi:hypothetical protein